MPEIALILGLGMIAIYIIVLFGISYLWHKKSLFSSPDKKVDEDGFMGLKELDIDLNYGESSVVLSNNKKMISNYLYNVLSGQNRELLGSINREGVNLVPEKRKHEFVYLCQPDGIPGDIKAGHFVSLFKMTFCLSEDQMETLNKRLNLPEIKKRNFGELKEDEKGQILFELALLKKSSIYMFHEFAKGMPADFVKSFTLKLKDLKTDGASILYITNDVFMGRKIGDYISFLKKEAALMTSSL